MSDVIAGADATLADIRVTAAQAAAARRTIARHARDGEDAVLLTEALGLDLPEDR